MKHRFRRGKQFCLLAFTGAGMLFWTYQTILASIPDKLYVYSGESGGLGDALSQPLVTFAETVETGNGGSYTIDVSLGHVLPLKTVKVETLDRQELYVSGEAVGIYMETDGVMIIDAGTLYDDTGLECCPAEHIVKPGDYIKEVDGEAVSSKQELIRRLSENHGEALTLSVLRNGEPIEYSLTPRLTDDGSYKLGIWVRDNLQGVGTLTFVSKEGWFGALGHGISDMDTGKMLDLSRGLLYKANILAVSKGSVGNPGELKGSIFYNEENVLGAIEQNEPCGIFGHVGTRKEQARAVPVTLKQDIELGKASILCDIGDGVEEFDVEIQEISLNQKEVNKSFIIHVTDPKLIEATGGIVQGMSGAPILQNGSLVGAVTHVFVNDPTKGYGIFIENMLEH
jgi:stage IV sporulation protein B